MTLYLTDCLVSTNTEYINMV